MKPITARFRIGLLCSCVCALTLAALTPAQTPPANDNIDLSVKLNADAKASFARVKDYIGMFYKQERINGQLQPEQTIQIRVRQQPFSVYMKWLGPQKFAGQEACFVAGKNNNQMRAKASGPLLGALGFINLDPRDPKAMANNRHPITEAGLGHLIEQIAEGTERERLLPPDQLTMAFGDYRFLNRPVTRLETTRKINNGQFYAHRTVVYFDRETRLPVRFEAYDWPRPGGQPGGDLLECYSFVDLKFNVGLTDAAFNY
jgi:hypothetical protein